MVRPLRSIRRFDVFAEYRKQEQEGAGVAADEAKGYGLWVAKVVAAGRFGRRASASGHAPTERDASPPPKQGKWHELDGQPQTDSLFDREVVDRMGADFYRQVFVPAIAEARQKGLPYEAIRDRIRRDWKPASSP
jgi:hypothetical protein